MRTVTVHFNLDQNCRASAERTLKYEEYAKHRSDIINALDALHGYGDVIDPSNGSVFNRTGDIEDAKGDEFEQI